MPEVIWPKWNKLINDTFVPLMKNRDRYIICYGSRGSAKSDAISKKVIFMMLTHKFFRGVLIRNTYGSIEDSSYKTIKDNVYAMGLESLFDFNKQPLRIFCKNGNEILARGCDDTTKLKSIKDPTFVWWEEDIPTEEDFITVTTSIRTQRADLLQEIFTINPEVEGDYQENWFYKKFFGDRIEKSFNSQLADGVPYTVHHSTYKDNRWLPKSFGDFLESMKNSNNPTNRYYYTVYTLGQWGNKQTGGLFYKMFDRGKHIIPLEYRSDLPIWISFDFNVNPGMHCLIAQVEGKHLKIIDEVKTVSPFNNTAGICREIVRRYQTHQSGVFVTGDPSGKQEDTRTEKGYNDYTIIRNELKQFNPSIRVDTAHPPIVTRGNFINNIFEYEYKNIRISISDKCVNLINDLLNTKEASDGTKFKQKVKDSQTGVTYEKVGHLNDCLDYALVKIFTNEFLDYKNGGAVARPTMGKRLIEEGHNY